MRILRSFPEVVPVGRSFVSDEWEKMYVSNYDHREMEKYNEDILLLEWDIAVSPEQLEVFSRFIFDHGTDRVCVAPYRLYPISTGFTAPVWCHRKMQGVAFLYANYVDYGDPFCNLFSFGMTYFPRELVKAFPKGARLTDTNFSMWHHSKVEQTVPICWNVIPVHLNYNYSEDLIPNVARN